MWVWMRVCVCFLMCHMSALPQVGSLLGDDLESIVCSLLSKLHSVATFTWSSPC